MQQINWELFPWEEPREKAADRPRRPRGHPGQQPLRLRGQIHSGEVLGSVKPRVLRPDIAEGDPIDLSGPPNEAIAALLQPSRVLPEAPEMRQTVKLTI